MQNPLKRSLPSAQIIPVQDGIETKDESSLSLPPPERANREHHDVTLTDR
jgi:hypothetical protein